MPSNVFSSFKGTLTAVESFLKVKSGPEVSWLILSWKRRGICGNTTAARSSDWCFINLDQGTTWQFFDGSKVFILQEVMKVSKANILFKVHLHRLST